MAFTSAEIEASRLMDIAGKTKLAGNAIRLGGKDDTIKNMEWFVKGVISECTFESKRAAEAIFKKSQVRCPEESGRLKGSGDYKEADIMEVPWEQHANIVPTQGFMSKFSFQGKVRNAWWVFYDTEYARTLHENENQYYTIKTEINPNATSHWLFYAYEEYSPYFSRRLMDRFQAQALAADRRAQAMRMRLRGIVTGMGMR